MLIPSGDHSFVLPNSLANDKKTNPLQSLQQVAPSRISDMRYHNSLLFESDLLKNGLIRDPMRESSALSPYYNPNATMLRNVSPTAFDFNETRAIRLSDHIVLSSTGSKETWPALGGMTMMNGNVTWSNEKFSFGAGIYGGNYFTPTNLSPALTTGLNLNAAYHVTDWLDVRAWGNYSLYQKGEARNPNLLGNPNFPQRDFGGAFDIWVTEHVGARLGVDYEFNPFRNKMERRMIIAPIFR